jgi:hypothetical protein
LMRIRDGDSSDPGWKKLVHWIICIDPATNTSFHMQKNSWVLWLLTF